MARVLVAADAEGLHNEIRSVLAGPGTTVDSVYSGADVRQEVADDPPDLVVLDLQIGTMGGMATCLDLRLEEGAGRMEHVPVLMLLDRRPDVFLARRSKAEGWLLKPLDPIRLRRAAQMLMDGGTYFDASYLPEPVAVPVRSGTVEDSGK